MTNSPCTDVSTDEATSTLEDIIKKRPPNTTAEECLEVIAQVFNDPTKVCDHKECIAQRREVLERVSARIKGVITKSEIDALYDQVHGHKRYNTHRS